MEIRIVIDAPRGWLRRIVAFVLVPVGVIGAAALWAHASGVPNTFSANQLLSASQMNANFAAVTTAALDGGVYSVGPTLFVGATPAKTPGDLSGFTFGIGYVAAKRACEFSFPSRPTAHMCTAEEIVRFVQLGGIEPLQGWYATGLYWEITTTPTAEPIGDCDGWTSASGTHLGSIWAPGAAAGGPSILGCSNSEPILCCD